MGPSTSGRSFARYDKMITFFLMLMPPFIFAQPAIQILDLKFFHSSSEGQSRLVISANGSLEHQENYVEAEQMLVVDFPQTGARPNALRPLDTSEFSQSGMSYASLRAHPSNPQQDLRLILKLKPGASYAVQNADNQLIIKIYHNGSSAAAESDTTALSNDETNQVSAGAGLHVPRSDRIEDILENLTLSGAKQYLGKKISINVRGVSVVEVLNMIADVSGFNIFVDQSVASLPPITLAMNQVPWDELLDTVLNINKLAAFKYNNILNVTTMEKAQADLKKKQEEEKSKVATQPMLTKIFSLNYAKPADVQVLFNEQKSEKGTISLEARTNKIIVKDTLENIEKMEKLLSILDTQTPQVLIESKIVEISEDHTKDIGLGSLNFNYNPLAYIGGAAVDSPKVGFSVNTRSATVLGFSVDVLKRLGNFNATLRLLESQSKAKVVSSPRIITQNNVAASISSSDAISYRQDSISGNVVTASWAQATASTALTVTPYVNNNGTIALNISVNKSSFAGQSDSTAPPKQRTNSISTNVLVDNGATVVLGGLYQVSESEAVSGVPFFKDLPLVGWLFRSSYAPVKNKSELMVFITPSIIKAGSDITEQSASL